MTPRMRERRTSYPQRGQAVLRGGGTRGGNGMRVDFGGAEGAGRRDLCEADQGVHHGE
jgi:hypothetical protein